MNKLLTRLGVAGALTAVAVWAVKNQDKLEEKLIAGIDKAKTVGNKAVGQVVVLADVTLTKLATDWLKDPHKPEPSTPGAAEKPGDEYTHTKPLLDDGDRRA